MKEIDKFIEKEKEKFLVAYKFRTRFEHSMKTLEELADIADKKFLLLKYI